MKSIKWREVKKKTLKKTYTQILTMKYVTLGEFFYFFPPAVGRATDKEHNGQNEFFSLENINLTEQCKWYEDELTNTTGTHI